MALRRLLNAVAPGRRHFQPGLPVQPPCRPLLSIRSKSTHSYLKTFTPVQDLPVTSSASETEIPYVHSTGRGVCPKCGRITSLLLDRFPAWDEKRGGQIRCECGAHLGIRNPKGFPSYSAHVEASTVPGDTHDDARKFMQDARKLLSVGRAFRTLVTQKGHLRIRSSIKFPYDKELELLHQPEISKQVYPYIEDMVRSIAWLADKLLRPRYDVLRGDPRFEKKVPEMKKTMQRLGEIRKDMQELLPKGYDVGTATDRYEVRASPPEIALELLAQTVQAEREGYPRTSDECKVYRELTRAPLLGSQLTLNLVKALRKAAQDVGLVKGLLPWCSYVIFPPPKAESDRKLLWVTVRSTLMSWNHKGQRNMLKERRDGLAKSFPHLSKWQNHAKEKIKNPKEVIVPRGYNSPCETVGPYIGPGIAFDGGINHKLPCQLCELFHRFHNQTCQQSIQSNLEVRFGLD